VLTISKVAAEKNMAYLLSVDTGEYSCGDKQALETFNIDASKPHIFTTNATI